MPDPLPALAPISVDNASKVRLQAILSYGSFRGLAWSSDEKTIAVGSTRGIWLFSDLAQQPVQLQTTIRDVNAIDISPDSQWLASAEEDGVVRLWNLESRSEGQSFHVPDVIPTSVKFSVDKAQLFVGYSDGNIRVWDLSSGVELHTFHCQLNLPPDDPVPSWPPDIRAIAHLVVSKDGKLLAACSGRYMNIFLWDLTSFTIKHIFEINPYWQVHKVEFSVGSDLLIAHDDYRGEIGHYNIWNTRSGQLEGCISFWHGALMVNEEAVWQFQWAENFRGGEIFNRQTGQRLPNFGDSTNSIAYNREQTQAIVLGEAGTLELLDIHSKQIVERSQVSFQPAKGDLTFSPDNSTLFVVARGQGYIPAWDIQSSTLRTIDSLPTTSKNRIDMRRVWFEANGSLRQSYIAETFKAIEIDNTVITEWEYAFEIWDCDRAQVIERLPFPTHPDLRRYALSHDKKSLAYPGDNSLEILNFESRQLHTLWRHKKEIVKGICFSPHGRYLAAITDDPNNDTVYKITRVFDLQTNKELFRVKPPAFQATFSPSEEVVFITSRLETGPDNVLLIWDLKRKSQLGIITGLSPYIHEVAFDPSGDLAIVGAKNRIEIWHWKKQALLGSVALAGDNYFDGLGISPDGKMIATTLGYMDGIHIWGVMAQ